ncbi:DUF3467 domain-containing protein [Candidatus Parcubacteria bacterium]|nr:DUF3467 domain-containing protein [Patescibacteria group bacterium]MBU4482103.1 DUF3467 domain-containing protein [Patescibacteria group bacterium]MCG2686567.1 DUF3467 domain-containing protein [Candidatus Parcubacteria bacterium]
MNNQNQQNNPNPNPSASSGQAKQMQIKIDDNTLKGVYANAMQVFHSKEEFVLDFMNLSPHQGVGVVSSKIIMSPGHLKRVIFALKDNLSKYENQFGKIEEADAPNNELGFKTK